MLITAAAVCIFFPLFIILRHLDPEGIILYQGVALGVTVSVAQSIFAHRRAGVPWSTSIKDAAITFLLIYAFVFTVPTTADRAYSVKMLRHLADAPQGLSRKEIGNLYVVDFVDRGGIDKRLTEQKATGTLVEKDGVYFLTPTGKTLVGAFRLTCYVFSCEDSSR